MGTQSYLHSAYPKVRISERHTFAGGDTVPPARVGPRALLIVDEDNARLTLLAELLRGDGFFVAERSAIHEVFADALTLSPDLVVLGAEAADKSWADACRELRLLDPLCMMPIVLVGGGCNETQVVAGLDAGADDYVSDVTRVDEVRARIRAQLRNRSDRKALQWALEQRTTFRTLAQMDPLTRMGNPRHGRRGALPAGDR
jgi:DNA-binding response OmpR family regulator